MDRNYFEVTKCGHQQVQILGTTRPIPTHLQCRRRLPHHGRALQRAAGLYPERLVADTAYGSAELLNWLPYDQGIEPHIRVFDRPEPDDGTFCFLCALRSCANVIVRGPSRSKKQSSRPDLQAIEGLYSPLGRTSSARWVRSGHESAAGDGIVVHRPHRRTVERADTSDRINNKSDLVSLAIPLELFR